MPAAYGNRPAPFAFAGFDAAAPGCDGGAGGVVCAFLEPTQGLVFEHGVSRTKTLSLSLLPPRAFCQAWLRPKEVISATAFRP